MPLLPLTQHGFSALRARMERPIEPGDDATAPTTKRDRKQAAALSIALEQLEADYDRVLKRK